ncbi:uncharacterized protein LOC118733581 [Rhagoletis pomonella]|uniref:uncharacterized protein LOC118733581 n=1 Tax=Rhagoletis pomonella TaxID=28610 RepID=UPI00177AEC4C|nr:uncharacterized protein LOC118733581 [Rhagoletis pomonella]
MCKQSHFLRKCPRFLRLTPINRKSLAKKAHWCTNCLGHSTGSACVSTKTCSTCGGKHHTLLHLDTSTPSPTTLHPHTNNFERCSPQPATKFPNVSLATNNLVHSNHTVPLVTALIDISDIHGQLIRLRALVDQGSQQMTITEIAAQRLNIPITPIFIGYRPMGESQYKITNKGMIIEIHSIVDPNFKVQALAAIIPSISSALPLKPINVKSWNHIKHLPLADPHYAEPGQVDLLLEIAECIKRFQELEQVPT